MNVKPATTSLVMADGREETLVLSFAALWQLKTRRPNEYKTVSRILVQGSDDVMDYLSLLYAAYLCAHLEDLEGCEGFRKFADRAPEVNAVMLAANELVSPKKRTASAAPSGARPGRAASAE